MVKLFKNSWALFAGYGVLMIAHGLQGNLLGVRAVIEEFNFVSTGAMMSGYFVGYFIRLGFFQAQNGMSSNCSNNYNSTNNCFSAWLFLYNEPNPKRA